MKANGGVIAAPTAYAGEGQGAGPVFVTQRAGLFGDEGLDVQIELIEGAKRVVRALVDGQVLFGNLAAPALVEAVLDGAELVYITGGINQQFLVGRPGLTSVRELAGGKVTVGEAGQLGDLLMRFLKDRLDEQGIPGVEIIYGDNGRGRVDALFEGRADAAPLSPPIAIEARRKGCPFLLDFADYGLNFTLGGVATTRKLIAENRDVVERYVRAYVRGMHRYKTDKTLVMEVQQDYSGFRDEAVAEETYAATEPGFPRAPYPVTFGLQIILDTMGRTDPRASGANPKTMVDDSFVRQLDESGYIDDLYR